MNTFANRKAARIASSLAGVKYKFLVIESKYDGKVVGTFDSRKSAETFADQQISSFVGDTAAYRVWCEMQTSKAFLPSTSFRVDRVQA